MDQTISLSTLIQMGVIIMGLWGFFKVVKEFIKDITTRHDREQKWDEMVQNVQEERDKIYERYDNKLGEMETKIDDNHADTEVKLQEVRSELLILTDCMAAVLDGLHQQGCNGKVSEARENLDQYMRNRAHSGGQL
ncbi:MAG: hypothetical protein IKD59_09120 [Lachnospiraceae bacterium]|nr:hypothetical protein [Lachnospiraceae bacterium]MBR3374200.1 hypothetical protein [Bacillota bacterium]